MRLDSTHFRHAIGNKAPIEPFAIDRSSFQSEGLRLWFPVSSQDDAATIRDFSGNRLNAAGQNFEAGNFVINGFGGRAIDFNAGGEADADYLSIPADSRLTIGAAPATFSCWFNIRSYGLGSFTDFGRLFFKGSGFDFRFDAASGPFGAGANTRLHFSRATSGTTLVKAGGSDSEVPLNQDNFIVLTHDGGLAHDGVHIYVNGQEIAYTVETDGTGAFVSDAATDVYVGNRTALDRWLDGQLWDIRLILDRVLSPAQVRAMYDPAGRYALYQEHQVPMAVPAAAAVATNTRTASLQGALRRQASLVAAVDASLRAGLTIAAALNAAAQRPATGAAGLESALRAAQAAQTDLNAALRASLIGSAQLDSALRGTQASVAGLDANLTVEGLAQRASAIDAAVRRARQETASLSAALAAAGFATASLDAPLAIARGQAADLDVAMQRTGALVDSELQAALLGTSGGVAALDAVIGMVIAAAASRTFAVPGRAPHRVAASDRRTDVPFGQRRH
jgi:hypothetical protein